MTQPPQNYPQKNAEKYPHSEITKLIIGALFRVFKEIGYGYQERYYQRAFAIELERLGLKYEREQYQVIKYEGRIIGRYFVDFVIDKKVVVELKIASDFHESHMKQILAYLHTTKLPVGLLGRITSEGIKIRRFALTNNKFLRTSAGNSAAVASI